MSGECPSFVTVETEAGKGVRKPKMPSIEDDLSEPTLPAIDRPYHVYVPGVGGTGVITINAILAEAASLDHSRLWSAIVTRQLLIVGAVKGCGSSTVPVITRVQTVRG